MKLDECFALSRRAEGRRISRITAYNRLEIQFQADLCSRTLTSPADVRRFPHQASQGSEDSLDSISVYLSSRKHKTRRLRLSMELS